MIAIIGAGPVGCYTGYLLAKMGYDIEIFEQASVIGKPVQCTGIVSTRLRKIVEGDFVINTTTKAKISCGKELFLDTKNLVIDRTLFDMHLAEMAESEGAQIHLKHKLTKINKELYFGKNKKKADIIIGADGPNSVVAKHIGVKHDYFLGMQVRARYPNENIVEFYPGAGDFGWVVPESKKTARIGIVSRNPKREFDKFLELIKPGKILEHNAGLIPIYNPKIQTKKDNIYIVGDAAGMVKPTTAGGIVQGLLGAEALAESIDKNTDYEREWRKRIGKDQYISLMMRKIMDKFSKRDYEILIDIFDSPSGRRILETKNRDNISSFIPELILLSIKDPRMFGYLRYLF